MNTVAESKSGQDWTRGAGIESGARPWALLRALGSLRLALVLLPVTAGAVIFTAAREAPAPWPMLLALGLLGVNLTAAIAVHPALRLQRPLLAFHLALLAIIALAGAGRLTYLTGHVELSEGEAFSGHLSGADAGVWHPWGIRDLRFTHEGFTIDYLPGRQRDRTQARVSYPDPAGTQRTVLIGDQVPLVLAGYRFYTSFNKGFALKFAWYPRRGAPQRGDIHLPSYPMHEYRQVNTWTPPGSSSALWIQLQFDEALLDPAASARFEIPKDHVVVVRGGERRAELRPGGVLEVDGGRLLYEGVGTWMGYKVFYDWTIPWLLAACLVAALSLAWHFWSKFSAQPWLRPAPDRWAP